MWEDIKRLRKNLELFLHGIWLEQTQAEAKLAVLRERIQVLDDMIAALDRQRGKLLDLYLTTDFLTKDELQQKQDDVVRRRGGFGLERADLANRVAERKPNPADLEAIRPSCEELARRIDDFTFEEKRQVLETLHVNGLVVRGKKHAKYKVTLSAFFPKKAVKISFENHELVATHFSM